ncbi:heme-degrading monooxygenase HmoA [Breoghania corrubedonensis]|uniref:Heme-degrading monooxygenase HmoA n=1 Tax=Breoghania corrubedonensis TaxID=665038 RepID=A0A2T5VCW5_9HYPH|nr:antibiotic biosynthesis monooxygenase [Breoghania corrubedonensis]PTW61607.1 heme-degrading monooxygenase HmoA [Breoghania corrubedonensis]
MYIAMNRFRVKSGHEEEFETVWKNRDRHLSEVPGFVEFKLLKGAEVTEETEEPHTLFASHTLWASYDDFINWTKSEAFRAAHKGAGDRKPIYVGGPHFEGFEVLLTEVR